ncbi:MAG: hypothetical protein ACOZF0_01775 [Thermodesulfobacteriota bacterium]
MRCFFSCRLWSVVLVLAVGLGSVGPGQGAESKQAAPPDVVIAYTSDGQGHIKCFG